MNDWKQAQYLNISTRKRDGSRVDTPVWFAYSNGAFYLFSEGKAGKVKRIRNFSDVNICPCTITGKLTGDWEEAEAILLYTPKAATEPVAKLLKSAIANAENNLDLNREELVIAEIYANQGPTLKRFRPRAHGRASAIRKRTSHITVVLDQAK